MTKRKREHVFAASRDRRNESFPARACMGVDLQGATAAAVRAERTRQGIRYSPVASPDPGSPNESEKESVPVVGCLSSNESLVRWLDAPLASPVKAAKVFPSLLDIQLPFAIENCLCEFLQTERTPNRHVRALAVAARRKDAERALERFRARGWDPHLLDQEGLALWTQSLREHPELSGRRAVLYMGPDRWTLALGTGARFAGSHALRPGDAAQLVRLLKAEWGAVSSDGSAEETATLWAWAGPDAAAEDGGLRARLLRDWPGASVVHDDPARFLARALATRALVAGPYRCNLRAGPLRHPVMERHARRQAARPAWFCLAAGLALMAVNISLRTYVRFQESEANRRFAELRDELIGYRLPVLGEQALEQVRTALTKEAEEHGPFARMLKPSLLDSVWALTDFCRQHDVHLETLDMDDERMALTGSAPDWPRGEEVARFVETLVGAAELKRQSARDDGRIPWSISARPSP